MTTDDPIARILAKSDEEIMAEELTELLGVCVNQADPDEPQFSLRQVMRAMENSFESGKAHIQMLHDAEREALARTAAPSDKLMEDARIVLLSLVSNARLPPNVTRSAKCTIPAADFHRACALLERLEPTRTENR
jgi:hypothetical protein